MNKRYFYFDTKNRKILKFSREVEFSNLVKMNAEQESFYLTHRKATYDEILNAQEYVPPTPPTPPEPTIEELRENAKKEIDMYSRETLGKAVDVLGFCNAVAGTIYSKEKGLDGVYSDTEILSTAEDFLIIGKSCRELYDSTVKNIESAHTKEEIEMIIEETKSQFDELLVVQDDLAKHKRDKIREIEVYNVSKNVDGFFYNGVLMWLDKHTRTSLVNTLNSADIVGREQINIWYSGMYITLRIEEARQLLAALEIYATDCYNVTAQHKVAVNNMTSIEEVDAFDVTADYPQRLNFNTQA